MEDDTHPAFAPEPVAAWAVRAGESAFASVARAALLRDHARWGIQLPQDDMQGSPDPAA
ncbi:hypothetical protein [Streptomyces vilmorinianum]|uniref:hypothetical protein n=1 Tax=Streptomyces vilmorinianum TaxID=3051092 RepID=UPI001586829D|nr:hypothetical protein [Streptomyces vilmorinianum]